MTILFTALSASAVTGPYFGQTPPGSTPEVFAPGILSLADRMEGNIAFSPDGNECYFTSVGEICSIYYTMCIDNEWTPQTEAPFSIGHYNAEPSFSADGNTLYFDRGGSEPHDIWMVHRTAEGWSDPELLPSPINSSYSDNAYKETADGTAYFSSDRPGGLGGGKDIWRTRQEPGQPLQAEAFNTVNSTSWDGNPCIAPDESYLIFASQRPGGVSYSDLYVSFNEDDVWTAPVNMNNYCPGINISGSGGGVMVTIEPSLSPDGQFLFFARYIYKPTGSTEDIYWVENPFYVPPPTCIDSPISDFNGDCMVNFDDVDLLTVYWLTDEPSIDIAPLDEPDGIVNLQDFAVLAGEWLNCGLDTPEACNQ